MGEESQGGDGVNMDLVGRGMNGVLQIHTVPKRRGFPCLPGLWPSRPEEKGGRAGALESINSAVAALIVLGVNDTWSRGCLF